MDLPKRSTLSSPENQIIYVQSDHSLTKPQYSASTPFHSNFFVPRNGLFNDHDRKPPWCSHSSAARLLLIDGAKVDPNRRLRRPSLVPPRSLSPPTPFRHQLLLLVRLHLLLQPLPPPPPPPTQIPSTSMMSPSCRNLLRNPPICVSSTTASMPWLPFSPTFTSRSSGRCSPSLMANPAWL